ncbi:MAG: hypothetical protein U1A78_39995 [Polyangia bacterium]
MTQRSEPKVGWANDVVYWYSQLQQGKEVPEEMRSRVNELRQHLSAKGAARFLCGVAGGGADCLVPLPDKRTPVPKGQASKMRAELLPALSTLLQALKDRAERRKRGKSTAQDRAQARKEKKEQKAAQKAESERLKAEKAAARTAPKKASKAAKTTTPPPVPATTTPPPARKPRKEASLPGKAAKGGTLDLEAMVNQLASEIDPAELAKAAGLSKAA